MALKLMYISNNPEIARILERSGVDRVFVDLEYIGKNVRQKGMDTVQSHHTIGDIANIKKAITTMELLVRCNPIHDSSEEYGDSAEEINNIIANGADYIMLPYFKTAAEVKTFLDIVRGRAKTVLLFETPEAVEQAEDILAMSGIDEAYIGLNDLSIGYHKRFMFELLADGTVEKLALKFRSKGIPFGFGGIASVGKGALPAEKIIREHYRLFSESVILSRSFCNTSEMTDLEEIENIFTKGVAEIRAVEQTCKEYRDFFEGNIMDIQKAIDVLKQEGAV